MICIASFIIFSILGIFSIKYRKFARESMKCMMNFARLRPCDSGFSRKIRIKAAAKAGKIHPLLGKTVYVLLPYLSAVFVILFIASTLFTIQSVMNLLIYGTCNPATNQCIFS